MRWQASLSPAGGRGLPQQERPRSRFFRHQPLPGVHPPLTPQLCITHPPRVVQGPAETFREPLAVCVPSFL